MFLFRRRHPMTDDELSAYADGQLDDRARARVDAHLGACPACRDTLAGLRGIKNAMRALPRAGAPRSFALRQTDVTAPAAPRPDGALGRAMPLLGGIAAVAFLAFWSLVGLDLATAPAGGGDAEMAAEPAALSQMEDEASEAAEAPPAPGRTAGAEAGEVGAEEPPALTPPDSDEAQRAPPEPAAEPEEDEGDGDTALRAAQAATAAVAAITSASLAYVWWRRRA